MKQELIPTPGQPPAVRIADAVAGIQANVQMVQHVMREIMKEGTHFGNVPGTDKPSLLQPGAEQICLAFGWATKYSVEDLSYTDVVRYRVTCELYDRRTGELVGAGVGEASSDEEKYRWRKAICKEEFDATPVDRRRTAYKRGKNNTHYTVDQVRQEPADIANTVLKMASKRAHIGATRTASGCSDMFAQDLEDLPTETRESLLEDEKPKPLGEKDWKKLLAYGDLHGYTEEDIRASAAVLGYEGDGKDMPEGLAYKLSAAMKANPKLDAAPEGAE